MELTELCQLCQEIKSLCLQIVAMLGQRVDSLQYHNAEKPGDLDILLDYHDVCEILHISIRKLRSLQQAGDLTGIKIGRRRFYPTSEIQAYIQNLAQKHKTGKSQL